MNLVLETCVKKSVFFFFFWLLSKLNYQLFNIDLKNSILS